MLRLAFEAYEAGDVVMARRAAHRVLSEKEPASDAEARELAKSLFAPGKEKEKPTAKEVAEEILSRTEVPRKAYLFAAIAAAIILLMLALAAFRS
ncbi:MAG: hypothetical protein HYZ28_16300 [Myxococcales bacterium]|nr:hypothetical protein [Myxococcales bacterium]